METLVSLDSTGTVFIIDSGMAKSLKLFSDFPSFKSARLFQTDSLTFVLEIEYWEGSDLRKNRKAMSQQEVEELRNFVSSSIVRYKPVSQLDQSGRGSLLWSSTLISLSYHSWAFPAAIEVHDGRIATSLYLLTTGFSYYVPYLVTEKLEVTKASSNAFRWGYSRGIAHGIGLSLFLAAEDATFQGIVGTGLAVSIIEGFSAFNYSRRNNLSVGEATTYSAFSDYGLVFGLGLAHLTNAHTLDSDAGMRIFSGAALAGAGGGYFAGRKFGEKHLLSPGDSYIMNATWFLGAAAGYTFADLINPAEDRLYTLAAMGGSLGGLVIGNRMISGKNVSRGQGLTLWLGEISGGLMGLGIVYGSKTETDDPTPWLIAGTAGATAGAALIWKSLKRRIEIDYDKPQKVSWSVNVVPGIVPSRTTKDQTMIPMLHAGITF